MSGPDVFVVIRTSGDGYGHNSYEHVAWFFDEQEADASAKSHGEKFGTWHSVERVSAGTPMPEQSRW
jgi:hypothetical protein